MEKRGLLHGIPFTIARTLAITKARPIEGDNAVIGCKTVQNAADIPIFGGNAVSVQQHDRRTAAPLEVMKLDALHHHEAAIGGVRSFGFPR